MSVEGMRDTDDQTERQRERERLTLKKYFLLLFMSIMATRLYFLGLSETLNDKKMNS